MGHTLKNFHRIIITGASSGLGAALARAYARAGVVLGLLGRDAVRLEAVAAECRANGAEVEVGAVDVCDAAAMRDWLQNFDDHHPVDLLIANAGISGGTEGGDAESVEAMQRLFRTNVDGVWHSIDPLLARMRARQSGQIGIVASLAGYRGFPGAPAYSASKAAVRVYGEALRGLVHAEGVGVSVICPGFIRTPMTDINPYRMPFILSPEKAAAMIIRGLENNRARIAFPLPAALLMGLMAALPPALTDLCMRRLPGKPALH